MQRETSDIAMVNLAPVVEEVMLDLQPQIKQAQGIIQVNVGACPAFPFSAKNLRSIVYNLLSNAIKYRSPDRQLVVQIYLREEPTELILTVQDNGWA
jgi:signal transduction histidine kinase